MNQEQRQAYEWAKNQNYQSVAARYAKILAGLVDEITPPNEPLTIEQLREMDRFSPPIWDECLHEWCAVRPNGCDGQQRVSYIGGGCRPLESGRFYRRPPEGET